MDADRISVSSFVCPQIIGAAPRASLKITWDDSTGQYSGKVEQYVPNDTCYTGYAHMIPMQ